MACSSFLSSCNPCRCPSRFTSHAHHQDNAVKVASKRMLTVSSTPQTLTAEPATTHDGASTTPSIPPPLNIPPSRARLQLAARLAAKKKEEEEEEEEEVDASGLPDPDAADAAAVELAQHVPTEPNDIDPDRELSAATGLQITGLRGSLRGSAAAASGSRFTGLFSSSDSSSSGGGSDDDDDDERNRFNEDKAGRDETSSRPGDDYETTASPIASSSRGAYGSRRHGIGPRRPSTTEAKTRRSLIDDDEDEDDDGGLGSVMDKKLILNEAGESPFADQEERSAAGHGVIGDEEESSGDSSDEGLVEIRARRISR
nr:hypothetical protein CFP56_00627 [Quercus suber]